MTGKSLSKLHTHTHMCAHAYRDICTLLLGNNHETNDATAVARQQPASQWTGSKAVFSVASVLMAVHTMDTIEQLCFLCSRSPC